MNLAIIWHMHQPLYRQPGSDMAILPWVRLHAVKDYLHMAQVLARHPQVQVTFTLTPSLAAQLEDYASGRLSDRLMQLAGQSQFSPDDKNHLLSICFSLNEAIIRQFPPYLRIFERRHLARLNPEYFGTQTYRDLLVWFNLAWTDPNLLESDPFLAALVQKGCNFSVDDARGLMQQHVAIMGQILPLYRQLAASGQLELITVPYFHPILPLLVDTDSARRPSPGLATPQPPLQAPEDALVQLQWAVESHTQWIGSAPAGLWPSEGSVSPEILSLVATAGLNWLATDEAILGKSLNTYFDRDATGLVQQGQLLYHPWRLHTSAGDLTILFRDHELSDRVGFVYQHMAGAQGAADMLARLGRIAQNFGAPEDALITIILDGENAWEYYEHNGDHFLDALYQGLSQDPQLTPVTPSQHLQQHPAVQTLEHLASGSWIRGDFTTWMGDPAHITAWAHLRDLRQAYLRWRPSAAPAHVRRVQELLFAAEGSDWFWWYSQRNSSQQDALFDQLFRDYLIAAYRAMAQTPPTALLRPFDVTSVSSHNPDAQFSPRLSAAPDFSQHWANAGLIQPIISTGAMQQAGKVISALRYGNDAENLYFRVELAAPVANFDLTLQLDAEQVRISLHLAPNQDAPVLFRNEKASRFNLGSIPFAVRENIAEWALPLAQLGSDLIHTPTTGTLLVRDAAGQVETLSGTLQWILAGAIGYS